MGFVNSCMCGDRRFDRLAPVRCLREHIQNRTACMSSAVRGSELQCCARNDTAAPREKEYRHADVLRHPPGCAVRLRSRACRLIIHLISDANALHFLRGMPATLCLPGAVAQEGGHPPRVGLTPRDARCRTSPVWDLSRRGDKQEAADAALDQDDGRERPQPRTRRPGGRASRRDVASRSCGPVKAQRGDAWSGKAPSAWQEAGAGGWSTCEYFSAIS